MSINSRNNKNFFPTYTQGDITEGGHASNETLLPDKSAGKLSTVRNDSALRIGYN